LDGASTSAADPGSVGGAAGGQISGSSAASSGPSVIQASSAARFASSSALCPLAQWRASSSGAASISDEPGEAARSAKYVSPPPSSGPPPGTRVGPSVRRQRGDTP